MIQKKILPLLTSDNIEKYKKEFSGKTLFNTEINFIGSEISFGNPNKSDNYNCQNDLFVKNVQLENSQNRFKDCVQQLDFSKKEHTRVQNQIKTISSKYDSLQNLFANLKRKKIIFNQILKNKKKQW